MLKKFACMVVLLVLACSEPVAPNIETTSLEPIEPEPEWRAIYDSVETCVHRHGSFERVSWFLADSVSDVEGGQLPGLWLAPERPHSIAIHRVRYNRGGEKLRHTVRHESIHEILQLGSHTDPIWCECDARPDLFRQC